MFFPVRYQDFVVFDVRLLIPAKSLAEERIYLESVRRTPRIFRRGPAWGEERSEACLWIPEDQYDSTLQQIRLGLRHDADFLRQCIGDMHAAVSRLGETLPVSSPFDPLPMLEACVDAVAWFSSNWIHPRHEVRLALARLYPERDPAPLVARLLRRRESPLYLRANAKLREVAAGKLGKEEFLRTWGPVFARGDELGPLQSIGDLNRLISQLGKNPEHSPSPTAFREQETLRTALLEHTRAEFGKEASTLLNAQVGYLGAALDAKEDKHFVQQHAYQHLRNWAASAALSEKESLAERLPWFAPAVLPRGAGQLQWPSSIPST
jgi:hypothetical protein